MSEKMKTASRLISAIQVRSIRLVEVAAKSTIRSPGDVEDVRFNVKPHARVPELPRDGTFYVLASFELQIIESGQETPAVTMEATFELKYGVPADFENVTKEELAAFAEVNAIFNAWPYWREYIQSTFVRMNLPPIVLPVFRLSEHLTAKDENEKT